MSAHEGRLDRQLIDELRSARGRLGTATPLAMKVTLEELDALFRAVDERDELRRQTVGDWEPDFPPVRVEKHAGIAGIPAHWVDATPTVIIPEPGAYAVDADGATPLGREERETPPRGRPEIDGPGSCEACRGSGMVAVGPWGARPPKMTCPTCGGSGWAPGA